MVFPLAARNYLLNALAGTPDILERLLKDLKADDPIWDRRPDAERFTLREMVAHLADWEPIWVMRFNRIREESDPFLPSIDEGEMVITNDYAHQDPLESLSRFRKGRAELIKVLTPIDEPGWDRTCNREFIGPLTAQMLATSALGHDGYHLKQVVEWLPV